MLVKEDGILFAGDLVFKGRIPFVGQADSRLWLESLNKLLALKPRILVPGHGPASKEPAQDLTADPQLPEVFARGNAKGGGRSRAFRRGLCANRLEPVRQSTRIQPRQPYERLQHLPSGTGGARRGEGTAMILRQLFEPFSYTYLRIAGISGIIDACSPLIAEAQGRGLSERRWSDGTD